MTLQELSDAVAAANTSWNGLSAELKQEILDKLRPRLREGFDGPQRDWLRKFWLRVTAALVTGANNLLPPTVRITPRVGLDGLLYVNADLLTDCQPGETYEVIAAQIKARTIVRKQDNEWPEPAQNP